MFNKLKSVETITAQLYGTVTELESHAEDQLVKAHAASVTADEARARCDAHKAEHVLARSVATNIKGLLNA